MAFSGDPEWYHYVVVLGVMLVCCLAAVLAYRCAVLRRENADAQRQRQQQQQADDPTPPLLQAQADDGHREVPLGKLPVLSVHDDPSVADPRSWGLTGFVARKREEASRRLQNMRHVHRQGVQLEDADLGGDYRSITVTRPTRGTVLGVRCLAGCTVIGEVDAGGPADAAGLRAGMRVVAVDGQRVRTADEVVAAVVAAGVSVKWLVELSDVPPVNPIAELPAAVHAAATLPPAHQLLLTEAADAGKRALDAALESIRCPADDGPPLSKRRPRRPPSAAALYVHNHQRAEPRPDEDGDDATPADPPRQQLLTPPHASARPPPPHRFHPPQKVTSPQQVPLWPSAAGFVPTTAPPYDSARSAVFKGRASVSNAGPPIAPLPTGVMMGCARPSVLATARPRRGSRSRRDGAAGEQATGSWQW